MRHPGGRSSQLAMVPPAAIDCTLGRPPAPERLNQSERDLWERLVLASRPRWFDGSEAILETYVSTVIGLQRIETALRRARPGASHRFVTLSRLHRQSAMLAASLATRLRLTPSTAIDKNVSRDGDRPLSVAALGYPAPAAAGSDLSDLDDVCRDVNGERSFEKLRERMQRDGGRAFRQPSQTVECSRDEPRSRAV